MKQFHYTGWPDFGVPEMPHPLIAFVRRLENFKRTTDGPDIIHCRCVGGEEGGCWVGMLVGRREGAG